MSESRRSISAGRLLMTSLLPASLLAVVSGQQPAGDAETIVIERMALDLRSPETYHVDLQLQPVQSIRMVARVDGVIDSVSTQTGDRVSSQEVLVRMQSDVRQIEFERAQAALQLARLEHEASGDGPSGELAAARLEVATIDLRLAEQRLEDLTVRAPFEGTMTEVHVMEGQFVRAGDPLATLADLTRLAVNLPVSRNDFSAGDPIGVQVEDRTVQGEVSHMLPLEEEFDPLRDLILAISTARVTVDGADLSVGQAVSSELIPTHPVTEVPTAALLNTDDGQRKVQVVRDEYVRDVVVQLHGQNGEEHVFVSGRFEPTDELIVETSHALLEGTRIVPSAVDDFDQVRTRPGPTDDGDD